MNWNIKNKRVAGSLGLLGVGAIGGTIFAAVIPANAASTTTSTTTATAGDNDGDGHGGHGGALDLSGTITTVGPSSVTIKTSTGTTTYTVDSGSDIDKSGEASVSALKAGDAVTFSVNGTTIDKLHAGNEALNMPTPDSGSTSSTGTSSSTGA